MAGRAYFDYCTLHASIPMRYDEFEASYDFFFKNTEGTNRSGDHSLSTVKAHLEKVALVEHEFFHCRHFLSSTFGLFAHILSIVEQDKREYLIEECLSRRLFVANEPNIISIGVAQRYGFSLSCIQCMSDYHFWSSFRRFIFEPTTDNLKHLRSFQRHLARTEKSLGENIDRLIHLDLAYPQPPIFRNVRRVRLSDLTSLNNWSIAQIIEGLAIWREFLYVSHLSSAWPSHFDELTLGWLHNTLIYQLYRAAPDAILARTGCGLSTALPGVILDIALCGPFFSPQPNQWATMHPGGRFEKMLSVMHDLPARLKEPFNIERVDDAYYREVDKYFSDRLGWQDVAGNLADALTFLQSEIATSYGGHDERINDELARHRLQQFNLALHAKQERPSLFIFLAENNKLAGYLSQPPLTHHSDQIVVGPHLKFAAPNVLIDYMLKVALTLASKVLMNSLPGDSMDQFREVREFIELARKFLSAHWSIPSSDIKRLPNFEALMSDWLKFDWRDACLEAWKNQQTF